MRLQKLATTCSAKEACVLLGKTRSWFYKRGINDFLSYYQEDGKRREYLISDINNFKYWLMVRRGMIALGKWSEKSRVTGQTLPPGETMEDKRAAFEAWLIEDPHGADCPKCGGGAVQADRQGPVWCQVCG